MAEVRPPDWPLLLQEPPEIRKRRLDPSDRLCRRPGCQVQSWAEWHRCQMKKEAGDG
jgi:hypothetical protein